MAEEQAIDTLAQHIVAKTEDWRQARDNDHRRDWTYAWRVWYGEHSAEDKERQSERSKYISPDTQSAIEAAGAEIEEALFGREAWVDMGDPQLTSNVIEDMADQTGNFSEAILLGGIYGTGIVKGVMSGNALHPKQSVVAVEPFAFIPEPGPTRIAEMYSVTHEFMVPRHLVEKGMKDGIYRNVSLDAWSETLSHPDPTRSQLHVDSDELHILEWHGLVPAKELRRWERIRKVPQGFGDEKLVEAIVTVANKSQILRGEYNPDGPESRPFAAFQFERNPRRFWGRGIPDRTKWTQRGIDTEMRARQDSLAFSTFPMLVTNAQSMPRNADFSVRPGRNFVLNSAGPVRDSMNVLQFPPPDPQTYAHTAELSKKLEVASGQLMNGVSLGEGDISRTGSGVASMFMGSQIRRIARTIRNIEDQMMVPFLRAYVRRMAKISDRYPRIPEDQKIKVLSGLGIMAREFEVTQLTQVLAMIPDGPVKMLLARVILENSPMIEKAQVMSLVNFAIQNELTPKEEPPTAADEIAAARLEFEERVKQMEFQVKEAELAQKDREAMLVHERELVRIATEQDRIESDSVKRDSEALLNIAKAEAEEVGQQMELYKNELELLKSENEQPSFANTADSVDDPALPAGDGGAGDGLLERVAQLEAALAQAQQPRQRQELNIERDVNGLIQSINGRRTRRNQQGLIVGIE